MSAERKQEPLTLALPKGRIEKTVLAYLEERGVRFNFESRELTAVDESGQLRIFLVKNSDLPVYVSHGIAGLGICGDDVVYESGYEFFTLTKLPFGSTRMCLAGREDQEPTPGEGGVLRVASKYVRFTRDYFDAQGTPIELIKLGGSVELAPVLGLTNCIVDLVETGSTLKANKLSVYKVLKEISVRLFANPAYYKYHYAKVDEFTRKLASQGEQT